MRPGLAIAAIVLALVAACSSSHRAPEHVSRGNCDLTGRTASPFIAEQDVADFVYHDGAFYYAVAAGSPPILTERLGRVSCTLAGSRTPLSFNSPREGLAGFVTVGTPYYAIRACPSKVALAAERERRVRVYLRQRPTNEAPAVRERLLRTCANAAAR